MAFRVDPEYAAGVSPSDRIVAEIAGLIAIVGEGHTRNASSPDTAFPVLVRWLSEGLYIAGADHTILYGRYNSCEIEAFGFFQGVMNEWMRGTAAALVVDLRWNSGGNSLPGTWFCEPAGRHSRDRPDCGCDRRLVRTRASSGCRPCVFVRAERIFSDTGAS